MFRIKTLTNLIKRQNHITYYFNQKITSFKIIQNYPSFAFSDQNPEFRENNPKMFKSRKPFNKQHRPIDQTQPQQVPGASGLQSYYIEKFGKTKSDLLDQWLEMNNEQLQQECTKVGILASDKHIENIQNLFEYLKVFDQEKEKLLSEKEQDTSPSYGGQNQQPQKKIRFNWDKKPQDNSQGLQIDVKKHEEFMKNELNRLFNKKKKVQGLELEEEQPQIDAAQLNLTQSVANNIIPPNIFKFDLNVLRQSLQKRSPMIQEAAFQPIQIQHNSSIQDSQLVDTIFGMDQKSLDLKFQEFQHTQNPILAQMNLTKEDFDKMANLSKKKVLINLTKIQKQLLQNPNQKLMTMKDPNNIIKYAFTNWSQLDQESKEVVFSYIQKLQYNGLDSKQFQDLDLQLTLLEVQKKYPKVDQAIISNYIMDHYLEKGDNMYKDINSEKALQHAKIINQIGQNQDNERTNKIKSMFYSGIRKEFHKKNIRDMLLADKLQILKALPQVEGSAFQSTKSLHYIVLNDILTHEQDQFELLDKDSVFLLLERCKDMQKSRDLINKLKGDLLYIHTYTYSLDDFYKLFKLLSEDTKNLIDIKLFYNLLMKRSFKTLGQINNGEEFSKHIDFIEYIYKTNPILLSHCSTEMKYLLYRPITLASEEYLKLSDMVRFAKIFIPSLFKPEFLFGEMIESQQQSFKKDVKAQDLVELVEQVTKRVDEGQIVFEHLQHSTSRIHRNYKPYTEKSFLLLQRILKDFVETENSGVLLSKDELKVIFKMFQCQALVLKLFKNSEQAFTTIRPTILSQLSYVKENVSLNKDENQDEGYIEDHDLHFEQWNDIFNSYANIKPLLTEDQELLQLTTETVLKSLEHVNHLLINSSCNFQLDKILTLNKAILRTIEQYPELQNAYQQESPLSEIMSAILDHHYNDAKPFIQRFQKFKKNVKIQRLIQIEGTQALINKHNGGFISFLKNTTAEFNKILSVKLLQSMKNGRSLIGDDLVNLFKLVDRYSILNEVRPIIINVEPNLLTINRPSLQLMYGDLTIDENFQKASDLRDQDDIDIKRMIFNKYLGIFNQQPELFQEVGLGPLSQIMAYIFDEFTDQQVLTCIRMLGADNVDNYSETFIKKLYEKYSSPEKYEEMFKSNSKFFYEFAKSWPHFLKNNAILNQIIQIKGSKVLPQDQSETLQILTNKNVLLPELIEAHFETFIKMRDKDSVAKYMKHFLHSCAYLGYSNIDMQKLTLVYRRIYKTPDKIDSSELLDYFILLALSNAYYKDFDEKSAAFVEEGINLIEKRFIGIETMELKQIEEISGEEESVKLNYYLSIPTASKIYNKVLIRKKEPGLDFKKAYAEFQSLSESSEEDLETATIKEEIIEEEEQSLDDATGEGEKAKELEEVNDFNNQQEPEEKIKHEQLEKIASSQDKKIYDRKASESIYSEELEFHQFRKKKLQDLDKKSKHLILFSNINQLNFVDINKSDVVKAWVVLFHFRSKSFDSIIYDEFETITMRNTIGKSKGHELFTKFYLRLIEKSYEKQFKMKINTKCEKTGWPIDVSINLDQNNNKKVALYFLLHEEVCYNPKTQQDEPLAMQKLMLKHLTSISDYKVEYITENDFYGQKNMMDQFIDNMLFTKFDIV